MRRFLTAQIVLLALGVLNCSLAGRAYAQSSVVFVFDDPSYVDTVDETPADGVADAESDNLLVSLLVLGHRIGAFTGISATAFDTVTTVADVLLIPKLEVGDLGAALSAGARDVIQDFVFDGGGLIIHGDGNSPSRATNFLNTVFGFAITDGLDTPPFTSTSAAVSTTFAAGPTTVSDNNATRGLSAASLPPGSTIVYADNSGAAIVALIPFGSGQIVYLGWDWFNAAPLGTQDGGWLDILDQAIREVGVGPTIAVFRPSTGQWFFDKDQDGATDLVITYGQNGDIPVPGDYNGDGRTDLAVFRPSTGRWYIDTNRDGRTDLQVVYGASTDQPRPGDYNGDGRTDLAVFRPSTGQWFIDLNRDGKSDRVRKYGTATDQPLQFFGPPHVSLIQ